MGLQIEISSPHGITVADGYVKILRFEGDKDSILFYVGHYLNVAAREADLSPLDIKEFSVPFTETTNLGALYDYLKTLDEYDGAIDA